MGWAHRFSPRFSLRTLAIIFTLIALALGFRSERAHRQHNAVNGLRAQGLREYCLLYDYEVERSSDGTFQRRLGPSGYYGEQCSSSVPTLLLRNPWGLDYFHGVTVVYLYIPRPLDGLPHLKSLPCLKEVHFPWRGNESDEELSRLRDELPNVKVIVEIAVVG